MADFDSSLPVRTETIGDVKATVYGNNGSTDVILPIDSTSGGVKVDLVDSTGITVDVDLNNSDDDVLVYGWDGTSNQKIKTDSSGNLQVDVLTLNDGGNSITVDDGGTSLTVDGTVAATQSGSWTVDNGAGSGVYVRPGTSSTWASTQSGTWNVGLNAGSNSIGTLGANSGVDIGDVTVNNAAGSGAYVQPGTSTIWQVSATSSANTASNPLFVQEISGGAGGTAVHDYNTSAALAASASTNIDYTVTASKTLHLKGVQVSGSGKLKVEVKAGALASLASEAVAFTSTANPNGYIEFPEPIQVPDTSTGTVRLTITNKDDSAQDVYAYINGVEI